MNNYKNNNSNYYYYYYYYYYLHAFITDVLSKTKWRLIYAGSPWRVAVQNASKVGVAGSGIRQAHVGRSASFDVTGCKTPANVTVLGETQPLAATCDR